MNRNELCLSKNFNETAYKDRVFLRLYSKFQHMLGFIDFIVIIIPL